MAKAASGSRSKNLVLGGVAVVLLVGAVVFGFRDYLFTSAPPIVDSDAAANNEEVTNRILGGQPATAEPDPPGPKPEPGSGRKAVRPE